MLTKVGTKRLLVSRQDPETKRFTRVGVLSCRDDRYAFVRRGRQACAARLPLGRATLVSRCSPFSPSA